MGSARRDAASSGTTVRSANAGRMQATSGPRRRTGTRRASSSARRRRSRRSSRPSRSRPGVSGDAVVEVVGEDVPEGAGPIAQRGQCLDQSVRPRLPAGRDGIGGAQRGADRRRAPSPPPAGGQPGATSRPPCRAAAGRRRRAARRRSPALAVAAGGSQPSERGPTPPPVAARASGGATTKATADARATVARRHGAWCARPARSAWGAGSTTRRTGRGRNGAATPTTAAAAPAPKHDATQAPVTPSPDTIRAIHSAPAASRPRPPTRHSQPDGGCEEEPHRPWLDGGDERREGDRSDAEHPGRRPGLGGQGVHLGLELAPLAQGGGHAIHGAGDLAARVHAEAEGGRGQSHSGGRVRSRGPAIDRGGHRAHRARSPQPSLAARRGGARARPRRAR